MSELRQRVSELERMVAELGRLVSGMPIRLAEAENTQITMIKGLAVDDVTPATETFYLDNVEIISGKWSGTTASDVSNQWFGWDINAGDEVVAVLAEDGNLYALQARCP